MKLDVLLDNAVQLLPYPTLMQAVCLEGNIESLMVAHVDRSGCVLSMRYSLETRKFKLEVLSLKEYRICFKFLHSEQSFSLRELLVLLQSLDTVTHNTY